MAHDFDIHCLAFKAGTSGRPLTGGLGSNLFKDGVALTGSGGTEIVSTRHDTIIYHQCDGLRYVDKQDSVTCPADVLEFGAGSTGKSQKNRLNRTYVLGLFVIIALGRPLHAIAGDTFSRFGFIRPEECKMEHEYAMATILPALKKIIDHGDISDVAYINTLFDDDVTIEAPGPDLPHQFIEPDGYTLFYKTNINKDKPIDIEFAERIGREGRGIYYDAMTMYINLKYASQSTDCESLTASEVLAALPDSFVTGDIELDSQTDGGTNHSEVVTYAPMKDHLTGLNVSWGHEHTDQIQVSQRKN